MQSAYQQYVRSDNGGFEPTFAIFDVKSQIHKKLPLDKLQPIYTRITPQYFDYLVKREDCLIMAKGKDPLRDLAFVATDGTVGLIASEKTIEQVKERYKELFEPLQSVRGFDLEKHKVTVDVNAIFQYTGTRNARETLNDFYGMGKIKKVASIVGSPVSMGISFSAINPDEWLDYTIHPWGTGWSINPREPNPANYSINISWRHRKIAGDFLERFYDFANQGRALVKFVEQNPKQPTLTDF